MYPLQREHSSYYEIVVTAPKPLDLTWVLELVFYLDYCTMLLMVCGLSNCFSFYMHINLSTVVCYMHGVFDKMPQKDCIMWQKWGKFWFSLVICWHNYCSFFNWFELHYNNNFVLAYFSCYDNMVFRNQLSLTFSLSPSHCLHFIWTDMLWFSKVFEHRAYCLVLRLALHWGFVLVSLSFP